MPDISDSDRCFLKSLPRTVFNTPKGQTAWDRNFRRHLAQMQRAGLVRVELNEALAAGQPAMAQVTLTDAGRVALAHAIVPARGS